MALGKRINTNDPLTEHDIAERIDKTALRLLSILLDTHQQSPEFFDAVLKSRYLTSGLLQALANELEPWTKV